MAIGSNDDITRDNIAALRHYLVTDALLQDGDVLLACKRADITLQGGSRNSGCRYDMIEHDMRSLRIEDAPPILLRQFAKRLDCQGCRGIVAHYTINIHHDRLALFYSATYFATKDFFG
jgi:hypothetical protein